MSEMEEETPLFPNQVCVALGDFESVEEGDLSFSKGEQITIVRPTGLLYWYIGQNSAGQTGSVPSTLLESIESDVPPVLPPKPRPKEETPPNDMGEYEHMGSCGAAPIIPKRSKQAKPKSMTKEEKEILKAVEKEKDRRLAKGTLVVATATFHAQKLQDMSFKVHEEMTLLKAMPDLCWYYAQKVDNPSEKGVIPITHVRLVYMSDEEGEEGQIYNQPKVPGHDRLYEDTNEFISHSGWFTYPGFALGKEAQLHVLARKANKSYDEFMKMEKAVYVFTYKQQEKVFVGKALVLHKELMKHFDCFGKRRADIREIDDELCHHTDSSGWDLKVHDISDEDNLELEYTKKIVECCSLSSKDGPGLNESIAFTNMANFEKFWEWLSPN